MTRYLPTVIITISTLLIVVLLGIRGVLPPAPRSPKYEVIRRTVPPYRCRICTPHGQLCLEHESMGSFEDSNADNFQPVIKEKFNDEHIFGFETKHLRFREARESDADAIYAYARKPEVAARTAWQPHRSKFETIKLIDTWRTSYARYLIAPWAIEEKSSGTLIGTAGFPAIYPSEPRIYFSYCLSDTAWGKGYEVEVVRALIELGFLQMNCIRVETVVREDVPFSQRVLEQAGMNCEGSEPDYKRVGKEYLSMKHYAILRKDVAQQLQHSIIETPSAS